jgi:predicted Zn-dependent protease
VVYCRQRKYADALEAYKQSVKLAPDEPLMWENLGKVYLFLGQHDDAWAVVQRLEELDPSRANALAYTLSNDSGHFRPETMPPNKQPLRERFWD